MRIHWIRGCWRFLCSLRCRLPGPKRRRWSLTLELLEDRTVPSGYASLNPVSAYGVIQAEDSFLNSSAGIEPTTDAGGGADVGPLANGAWLAYRAVDFGATSPSTVLARVASGAGPGISGAVAFHLDAPEGPEIGEF